MKNSGWDGEVRQAVVQARTEYPHDHDSKDRNGKYAPNPGHSVIDAGSGAGAILTVAPMD